jgi:hypothetical protein
MFIPANTPANHLFTNWKDTLCSSLAGVNRHSEGASMFGMKRSGDAAPDRKKEQRKSTRKRVNTRAWIRIGNGFAVRTCDVIDLSETGARLSIEGEIPPSFALLMSQGSKGRAVRVKWRRGNKVGVVFV